jgi:hypothetical protein
MTKAPPLPSRRRRLPWWPWLFVIAGGLLLVVLLEGLAHARRQAQRAFDLQVQAALAQQPIVTGHLGELRDIKRMASAEHHEINATMSYRLQGEAGDAIAIVRFERAHAPLHIAQGLLRTRDGVTYPLVDTTGLSDDNHAENDPLRPRLEYANDGEQETAPPDIVIDIDNPARSDLDLIQDARRRLIALLARIDGVLRIYSMGHRTGQPLLLLQLDHVRMTALKLSAQDVRDALQAARFQPLLVEGGKEIYAEPNAGDNPRPPLQVLSSLTITPANAPAVPIARIAQLVWSTDESRQALGLVTSRVSRADPARMTTRVIAAMTNQLPTGMRIDVHPANRLRVGLVP